jgi:transcription initiation factor TFIIIB Brf1 subunit/transcription initiation factor TFIIB
MDANIDIEDCWNLLNDFKKELDDIEASTSASDDGTVCQCGSTDMIIEDTMQICKQCCAVVGCVIDNTAEWRYYGAEDNRDSDPSRCGLPTNSLLPKSSLGSMIGGCRSDNHDIMRIRMWHLWNSMPYNERTLLNVFSKILSYTANNGIPQKVIDDAKVLYKKASERKISRGDNKEGLIASCIYHACLINNVPRSSKEIAAMFNISPVVLNRGNARFQTLLKINVASSSPDDFISRFASKLSMNIGDIENCKRLVKFLEANDIMSDNSPTSSAAGILYYYSMTENLGFSKKQFSAVCNVSEVTIIKNYKIICKYKEFIDKHKHEYIL